MEKKLTGVSYCILYDSDWDLVSRKITSPGWDGRVYCLFGEVKYIPIYYIRIYR